MIDTVRKVLLLLSPRERRRAYLLFAMMLVMAFLDVVGVASIMPFMAVLANPDVIQTNQYLHAAYQYGGFEDTEEFLFFLGVVVFVALVVAIAFKAIMAWATTRFTQMRFFSIARRLAEGYLRQPYEWFLDRHSADLGKFVLSEVQLVVQGSMVPLLQFAAQAILVAAMLILLVAIDPILALVVGGGIGGAYGLTYASLRRLLDRIGKDRFAANQERFKALSEAFGGIKEVKISGIEDEALNRFSIPARQFARTQVIAQIVGLAPKFALEIIAFGGMLLIVLMLMRKGEGVQDALPIISVYTLAGYRLLPALQTAYNHATKLRFTGEALERLRNDLAAVEGSGAGQTETHGRLQVRDEISLRDVCFAYSGAKQPALDSLSLEIPACTTVGLVGTTGAGKSTAVDIILGLLKPQSGSLCVDSVCIDDSNRRRWQRALGYVPQHIFLSDDTIAANITFGASPRDIDNAEIERAARAANIHSFIMNDLPDGYATVIGERGVRLSGGQRQRIGIARAIYNRPDVLVLDEATSALDNITEREVMEAVYELSGDVTIIIIAHRLTTLRNCDRIFVLEDGRLADVGTFEELSEGNPLFQLAEIARR